MRVHAEVVNPETGKQKTTNTFHFTFKNRYGDVPNVMPMTYAGGFFFFIFFSTESMVQLVDLTLFLLRFWKRKVLRLTWDVSDGMLLLSTRRHYIEAMEHRPKSKL